MDWAGNSDSEYESIGRTTNGSRKVVDDQRHSDENCDSEGAGPSENGHSDTHRTESRPAGETFRTEGHERENFLSPVGNCSGSRAEDREDDERGSCGETTGYGSKPEEKVASFVRRNSAGCQSSEGGGEEAQPLTTTNNDTLVTPNGEGDAADSINDGSIQDVDNTKSASVEENKGVSGEGQKSSSNLHELAERLSEPLGMAVATVFFEVFEQNRDNRTDASPVDELSKLLGAALKESLFSVLGDERTIFVKNFRDSFRSTYKTIRSVRRAYVKAGGKLTSSRQPYPKSWGGSPSKPRRRSPSQPQREMPRRNLEKTYGLLFAEEGMQKHLKFGDAGVTKRNVAGIPANYPLQLNSDEETTIFASSFASTSYGQKGEDSYKSCSTESLQSSFFTGNNLEQDGHSDTAGSFGKSSSYERLQSSFWTSSNLEQGAHYGTARSNSMKSVSESLESPMLHTPNARDVKKEHLDTEDSQDGEMLSATNSNSSDEWVMVDRDDTIAAALGQNQGHLPVTEGGGPMLSSKTSGSSRSLGNPGSLLRGFLPWISRNSAGRVNGTPSEHPADSLPQARSPHFRTSAASNGSQENTCLTAEPSMNTQGALRRGEELFGRTDVPQEGNSGRMLVQRRSERVRRDLAQFTGSSLEDTVLLGVPPVFDYGVLAGREALFQRHVEAQEAQNHLRSLELAHSMARLSLKEENLQLQLESNILMRENVDLSRSKVELKEFELEDRKLTAAHHELSRMCADELVAGLCLMLLALAYSAWQFSYTRLSKIVTMCQLPVRQQRQTSWLGTNWVSSSLDAVTWQLQAFTCEVTKAGRMVAGLVLIAFVATTLLRRSVTSSSQAMPATIIIVVLAGICGFAGKISIDSLGGDGFLWVILWELLCLLHTFATCCTPWLYKYLYGPSSKFFQARTSLRLKFCSLCARFVFHAFLVFGLPVMAGLLPFASPEELNKVFWEFWQTDSFSGAF